MRGETFLDANNKQHIPTLNSFSLYLVLAVAPPTAVTAAAIPVVIPTLVLVGWLCYLKTGDYDTYCYCRGEWNDDDHCHCVPDVWIRQQHNYFYHIGTGTVC